MFIQPRAFESLAVSLQEIIEISALQILYIFFRAAISAIYRLKNQRLGKYFEAE